MDDEMNRLANWKKFAEAGYVFYQLKLSRYYYYKDNPNNEDYELAIKYVHMAEKQKHPDALMLLGLYYHEGKAVVQDNAKAYAYFKKATKSNNPYAYYQLAKACIWGWGGSVDYKNAAYYLKCSANLGLDLAQYNLGRLYLKGLGVQSNKSKAAYYFSLAAEQGLPEAENTMGYMYLHGIGVEPDNNIAFNYYLSAARQNYASAQNGVALMYHHGIGTELDYTLALKYYHFAIDNGDTKAADNLKILKQDLALHRIYLLLESYKEEAPKPVSEQSQVMADKLISQLDAQYKELEETKGRYFSLQLKLFKKNVAVSIENALSVFDAELTWQAHSLNLIKKLSNVVLDEVSFGQVHNFFSFNHTKSGEFAVLLKERLDDQEINEQIVAV